MTVRERSGTRTKIMRAAEALAHEVGPGNLSLDGVAARAGVSKGGLLYHFPSKAKLMEALVEEFLGRIDAALTAAEGVGRPNGVVKAYIDVVLAQCCRDAAPPTGLLAALAEDPGLLDPVRWAERDFLMRIRANATDPEIATVAFLVVHGIRGMALCNMQVLQRSELEAALGALGQRIDAAAPVEA